MRLQFLRKTEETRRLVGTECHRSHHQDHWWCPAGIYPEWICSLAFLHTQSIHPVCETSDRTKISSRGKINNDNKYIRQSEKKDIFFFTIFTLMWSKTAVATLVWRSISLFFSKSSGRELLGDRNTLLILSLLTHSRAIFIIYSLNIPQHLLKEWGKWCTY